MKLLFMEGGLIAALFHVCVSATEAWKREMTLR